MTDPTPTDRDKELARNAMSDSLLKAPDPADQAYCAHRTVICVPRDNGDGTVTDRWVCQLCDSEFVPAAQALAQARREGREEAVETMKPELYRLGMVEVWARRHGGNIKVWATKAMGELEKPGGERHAAGHLHRIIEAAQSLLDQPPEGEKTP